MFSSIGTKVYIIYIKRGQHSPWEILQLSSQHKEAVQIAQDTKTSYPTFSAKVEMWKLDISKSSVSIYEV